MAGLLTNFSVAGRNPNLPLTVADGWNIYNDIKAIAATGTGDVSGPASSTDHAIARWDGATGKLLQDSPLILSDAGNINLGTMQIDFAAGAAVAFNTDNGAYLTPYINLDVTTAQVVGLAGGQLQLNSSSSALSHNTEISIIAPLVTYTAGVATVNMSAVTGSVLLKNGTAGAVAIGNAVGNGLMFGVNTVSISTNGVEKWMVNSSGALNPIAANTYDIGGSTTIRDIGVGRDVLVGGSVKTDAIVSATAAPLGITSLGDIDVIVAATGNFDVSDGASTAKYSINGNVGVSGSADNTNVLTIEGGIITGIV